MSILKTLAREHRVFSRLIDSIERSLDYEEQTARAELRDALLVLFPALDKHEEIEDLVFERPPHAPGKEVRRLLTEVERQHKSIGLLRRDLNAALDASSRQSFDYVKSVTLELVQKLRLHFQTEESRLWPCYEQAQRRSMDQWRDRLAREGVKALERDVELSRMAIDEYLGGRK
jgi:hemerythrin